MSFTAVATNGHRREIAIDEGPRTTSGNIGKNGTSRVLEFHIALA